jgi:hypothetical protein
MPSSTLSYSELVARCIELGILEPDVETTWNGQGVVTEDGWYVQLSPKQFPERVVRMTIVDGQHVGDVFDDTGFLFRLGDVEPDDPSYRVEV